MHYHLIVFEVAGADESTYHAIPFRLAGSMSEAMELIQDYMRHGADWDVPDPDVCPDFILIYPEWQGTFMTKPPMVLDSAMVPNDDAYQKFLAATGRI